jgi:hypothetical protein
MSTCAAMGQVAGTCAWLTKKLGILPGNMNPDHITLLQQRLLREDHYVPGIKNEDQADLALTATVSATSSSPLVFPDPTVPRRLDIPLGILIPVSGKMLDAVGFLMESSEETEVSIRLRKTGRTCDFTDETDVALATSKVPAGSKSWIEFTLSAETHPDSLYWIAIDKNPRITVYGSDQFPPTGTVTLYKPFKKWHYLKPVIKWQNLQVTHDRWNLCLKTYPLQYPYEAENILSGVTRPDTWTNIWISDAQRSFPQSVVLAFRSPVSFTAIYLTFDTNLGLFPNLHMEPLSAQKETVRDYRLWYESKGGWKKIGEFRDNFLRRRVHQFQRITAEKIKLEVMSAWGNPSARIFEIRVYDELNNDLN